MSSKTVPLHSMQARQPKRLDNQEVDNWPNSVLSDFHLSLFSSKVLINNGFTPDREDYEFCAKVENMVLPPQGYFGISAATGGLAGDFTFQVTFPLMILFKK